MRVRLSFYPCSAVLVHVGTGQYRSTTRCLKVVAFTVFIEMFRVPHRALIGWDSLSNYSVQESLYGGNLDLLWDGLLFQWFFWFTSSGSCSHLCSVVAAPFTIIKFASTRPRSDFSIWCSEIWNIFFTINPVQGTLWWVLRIAKRLHFLSRWWASIFYDLDVTAGSWPSYRTDLMKW